MVGTGKLSLLKLSSAIVGAVENQVGAKHAPVLEQTVLVLGGVVVDISGGRRRNAGSPLARAVVSEIVVTTAANAEDAADRSQSTGKTRSWRVMR